MATWIYPWVVRNLIYPLHERLTGRRTLRFWRDLERSQWYSFDALRAMQERKLRDILAHAWKRCRAHRDRLQSVGVAERDLDEFQLTDLVRLPLLDKDVIRQCLERFVDWELPGGVFRYTTGGSTGSPLIFYFDRRRQAYDQAARMRTHAWFDVRLGEKEVYLWGSPVELSRQDRLKALRDRLTNQMLLSAFEMSAATMATYLERIRRFRPACLFGYPSSLALLASCAQASRFSRPDWNLKAVFVTGEMLYPYQRERIEQVFQSPVANCYGSRDGGFIAHECPLHSMHITAENVIVEAVGPDGAPLPEGERGELVVTHLDNYALPFLRYRTGDIGRLVPGRCACGRALPMMEICDGRTTDQICRPDGTIVHALALIYTLREIPGVREFKIRQPRLDSILVSLVTEEGYSTSSEQRIRDDFQTRLGANVCVEVEYVGAIPPEKSGKHRYVVSDVAIGIASDRTCNAVGAKTDCF